jgi:hypothetical protein
MKICSKNFNNFKINYIFVLKRNNFEKIFIKFLSYNIYQIKKYIFHKLNIKITI